MSIHGIDESKCLIEIYTKEEIDSKIAEAGDITSELSTLNNSIEALNNRINSEIATLNNRIDSEVATLNNRINTADDAVKAELRTEIDETERTLNLKISTLQNLHNQEITAIDNVLTELEDKIIDLGQSLNKELASVTARIVILEAKV